MLTNGTKGRVFCLQPQWVRLGNILKLLELVGVG